MSLRKRFPKANADALDLLSKLLEFNPNKRYSVEEAIEHPYLSKFRQVEGEIVPDQQFTIPIDDN